jgi:signal transduction histidine kinase
MKLRSLLLIAAIVLLPLAALSWAGVRLAASEQRRVEQRFEELMEQRLADVNRGIERHFEALGRTLRGITQLDTFEIDELRRRTRSEPQLLQLFVLDPDGQLLYPNPAEPLNATEGGFLSRASRMFTEGDLLNAVELAAGAEDAAVPAQTGTSDERTAPAMVPQRVSGLQQSDPSQQQRTAVTVRTGWFVWYWDRGRNLIYWQRRPSGHIVGAALERARWMADLVAMLPETRVDVLGGKLGEQSPIRLLNSQGQLVYQWGDGGSDSPASTMCELNVAAPLDSWRLQCQISAAAVAAGTERTVYLNLLGGMVAAAAALCGLGLWLYRDYAHDMRNAAQQVSFVNQVSHELKTPLTNIRMYAELLDDDLSHHPDLADSQKRLAVITGEAQRLSRLIGNVLTFARQERGTLEPRYRAVAVRDAVVEIVERFRPALEAEGIIPRVEWAKEPASQDDAEGSDVLQIDPDFLEQILGNLINNVERYAAGGHALTVRVGMQDDQLIVDVIDAGPGIPSSRRDDVFRPFSRLTNAIDQPAGTGIGLSIARDLARRHGGDLRIMPSQSGSHFQLTLSEKKGSGVKNAKHPSGRSGF